MICTLHQADCWGVKSDMVGSFNLPDPNLHSTPCPCAAYPPCGAPPPHTPFVSQGNAHTHMHIPEKQKRSSKSSHQSYVLSQFDLQKKIPSLHKPGTTFLKLLQTQCHQLKQKHRVEFVMCCLFSITTTHPSPQCTDNYLFVEAEVPCDPACMHIPAFSSGHLNWKAKT